jgi:glycosyltransferase involved in cell wall biosynthesis
MPRPLISIVIPAFNVSSVVAQTLLSVQGQTFSDFEAIIVDDGSTDDTATIIRRFCDIDSRFHFISQSHAGASAARNAAIEQAGGEFIAFLDADDVWFPEKLFRQIELFRKDPRANYVFTNFFMWDGERDLSIWYPEDKFLPEGDVGRELVFNISNVCAASMSTAMVRREMFCKAGLFDSELVIGEDWDLWLRMAEHGLWVCGTCEPLARYRRWSGNVTNQKLKSAEANVFVLEKNLRATRRAELRPLYRCSLAFARSKVELIRASQLLLKAEPDAVPRAIWKAWCAYPRRLKWLMWYVLAAWPEFLGGCITKRIVHDKLKRKF